jgi:hypothetical protein
MNTDLKGQHRQWKSLSVFICTTIHEGFHGLRKFRSGTGVSPVSFRGWMRPETDGRDARATILVAALLLWVHPWLREVLVAALPLCVSAPLRLCVKPVISSA